MFAPIDPAIKEMVISVLKRGVVDLKCHGQSIASIRTVYVNADTYRINRVTYHGRKGHPYHKTEGVIARYSDFRHTLVEELVHYRFPYLKEGRDLEKRNQEVLRGKTFSKKHIHLYAFSPAKHRKELRS